MYFKNLHLGIQRFDDGTAIVSDSETQMTHVLNWTALLILDLCVGCERDELFSKYIKALAKEGCINPTSFTDTDQIKKDFNSIFDYMVSYNFLITDR